MTVSKQCQFVAEQIPPCFSADLPLLFQDRTDSHNATLIGHNSTNQFSIAVETLTHLALALLAM